MRLAEIIVLVTALWSGPAAAGSVPAAVLGQMAGADIVIAGEVHDNPGHHLRQADVVRALRPKAVVWEMLTPDMAAAIVGMDVADGKALAQAMGWSGSGWPSFDMYAPIFAASGEARHYGGQVPRKDAFAAAGTGVVAAFGARSAEFGLSIALSPDSQRARETDQQAAHCGAMPEDKLSILVDIQRLRDAVLARQAATALDEVGGPVVVITGNGHARRDRGIPVYLARARPNMRVFVLGQSEAGQISGTYDAVLDSPAVPRPDPCLAFQKAD